MLADVELASDRFARVVECLSTAEFRAPSRLPGWTRSHVVAHVALNAEGFVAVAEALRAGRPAVMYLGGATARAASIEALADATPAVLLERLAMAREAFSSAWTPPPPTGRAATSEGDPTFSSASVPLRRLRELQVHLVDLGVRGVGVEQWSDAFIEADLPLQWATVRHRTTDVVVVDDEFGVRWSTHTGSGAADAARASRREILAWVLDRGRIAALPSLEPWSNRSKWEHVGATE